MKKIPEIKFLVANAGIDKKIENGRVVPLERNEHYKAFHEQGYLRYDEDFKQFNDHLLILSEAHIPPGKDTSLYHKYPDSDKYFVLYDTSNKLMDGIKNNVIFTPLSCEHFMHGIVTIDEYPVNILNVHRRPNQ